MKSATTIVFAAGLSLVGTAAPALAQKNPPGVNPTHYQCYRVTEKEPAFKPRDVKLRDQFGGSAAKVLKPIMLCAPTDKNDLRARDRVTHYLCYEDEGPKAPEKVAEIVNQFGKEIVVVGGPTLLCVPSRKILPRQ
jgi:hypothetical protein